MTSSSITGALAGARGVSVLRVFLDKPTAHLAATLPTTEKGEGPADALRAERFETKALCGKHSVVPPIERQTFMIRESRTRWNEIVTLLN
jgi:hypothetical protein